MHVGKDMRTQDGWSIAEAAGSPHLPHWKPTVMVVRFLVFSVRGACTVCCCGVCRVLRECVSHPVFALSSETSPSIPAFVMHTARSYHYISNRWARSG